MNVRRKALDAALAVELLTATSTADAAAMWWVSALHEPANADYGDPNMQNLIATASKARESQNEEALSAFSRLLAEGLSEQLAALDDEEALGGVILMTDLHPDRDLRRYGLGAGLREGLYDWPWKVVMTVKRDEVLVSRGRNAATEVIWTAKS